MQYNKDALPREDGQKCAGDTMWKDGRRLDTRIIGREDTWRRKGKESILWYWRWGRITLCE